MSLYQRWILIRIQKHRKRRDIYGNMVKWGKLDLRVNGSRSLTKKVISNYIIPKLLLLHRKTRRNFFVIGCDENDSVLENVNEDERDTAFSVRVSAKQTT